MDFLCYHQITNSTSSHRFLSIGFKADDEADDVDEAADDDEEEVSSAPLKKVAQEEDDGAPHTKRVREEDDGAQKNDAAAIKKNK
jgi:hypothetical protein